MFLFHKAVLAGGNALNIQFSAEWLLISLVRLAFVLLGGEGLSIYNYGAACYQFPRLGPVCKLVLCRLAPVSKIYHKKVDYMGPAS